MRKRTVMAAAVALLVLALAVTVQALVAGERLSAVALVLLAHAALADALVVTGALDDAPAAPAEPSAEPPAERLSREFGLSPREAEVLEKYLEVRDIRACAGELFISPGTVKTHLSHIYAKAGVGGCRELLDLCDGRRSAA